MKVEATPLEGVMLLTPQVFGDDRGFFMETFRADEFMKQTGAKPFVQDNHSKSTKGILRELYFQQEQTQGKLVRVSSGVVYDVTVVDMRESSPTYVYPTPANHLAFSVIDKFSIEGVSGINTTINNDG